MIPSIDDIEELLNDLYCQNREPSVLKIRGLHSRTIMDYDCVYCNGYNRDCERYSPKDPQSPFLVGGDFKREILS